MGIWLIFANLSYLGTKNEREIEIKAIPKRLLQYSYQMLRSVIIPYFQLTEV